MKEQYIFVRTWAIQNAAIGEKQKDYVQVRGGHAGSSQDGKSV